MITRVKATIAVHGGLKSKRGPYTDWHIHEEQFECSLREVFDTMDRVGRILWIAESKIKDGETITNRYIEIAEAE
jgi:hypothetical protein